MQFYPGDWRSNANLRRCTHAERGIWIDVMCLMHDAEEYGILRWPISEIAQAVNCKPAELRALVQKGVLKGGDDRVDAFVHVSRHAGRDGDPVCLIPEQVGPVWYSSRMVRDEYVRTKRGAGTRFGDEPKGAPKPPPKGGIGEGIGGGIGYGPSSSSSTSINSDPNGSGVAAPSEPPDYAAIVWSMGVAALLDVGIPERTARSFLGGLCSEWTEEQVAGAVKAAIGKADPKGYMLGVLREKPKKHQGGLRLAI